MVDGLCVTHLTNFMTLTSKSITMSKTYQDQMKDLRANLINALQNAESLIDHPEFEEGSHQRDAMWKIILNLRGALYQDLYMIRDYLNIPHKTHISE